MCTVRGKDERVGGVDGHARHWLGVDSQEVGWRVGRDFIDDDLELVGKAVARGIHNGTISSDGEHPEWGGQCVTAN